MKFILRHLWNNRLYSSIKIAGLTMGMTCILLAILFVRDENSYDRFHEKAAQLFRITTTINNPLNGENNIMGATGQVQGPAFAASIPEIQKYVRIMAGLGTNFIGDQKPLLINYMYADEKFFEVFSFPLLYGNPSDALKELNSVVLTEQTALRFFGKTDVVGKTIKLEEGHGTVTFLITGVAKNIPIHSSIQFEAVLPFKYLQTMFSDGYWLNPYLSTFVLLDPQANVSRVKNKFAQIFRNEAGVQLAEAKMRPEQVKYGLQPITDIHLNIFEKGPLPIIGRGNLEEASVATYSYLLIGIATFILIMACINFLNLSIAGSLKRSKEIGVRKISGATASQIVRQFLIESSVLCCISYILAAILVTNALPVFNQLAQKKISFLFPSDIVFFIYGLTLMGICIIIVGLYPAIKLSLFNAAEVLYNKQKINGKNIFTKSLIVLQFTLAISLVIATIVYYRQMNFISQNDLGYDSSDIIKIHLPTYRNINQQTINVLRDELISEPSIIQIANGDMTPGDGYDFNLNGGKIKVNRNNIDQFFLPTLNIQLNEGRNFSSSFKSDSTQSVIINETFVKESGLKNPIGKQITLTDGQSINHNKTIVGVVKDFHYASLREKINPLIFVMNQSEYIWIKLQKGKTPEALSKIERVFKKKFSNYFYQYSFIDDEIKDQYGNEQRWKQIISYTSAVAIIICCIGLFGLAHFTTLNREKEIGIRKVLGASAINISRLLSQDFLKLVFLAIIIASPVAWYVMNNWLQNFSYRIYISWTDFLLAGVIALAIALITVSSQAFKAAIANPVDSLRME
jgi:ABC-type antimicrobial peptide transport system permease subunit